MTKGLHKYIRVALVAGEPHPSQYAHDVDKRTQAFGFILSHLSFSERLAIDHILTLGTQDAFALWADIKHRHERVTISRVWAHWKRLNAPPDTKLTDAKGIDTWFTGTIASYNAYKASVLDWAPRALDGLHRQCSATAACQNVRSNQSIPASAD